MELAALATAAVPGLSPTGVAAAADDARAFTSAVITDAEGNRWRVRAPQHQEAAMRLETELQVLRGFTAAIRAELPFRVPSVAGAVRRGELRTFVYNHLPGRSLDLDELTAGSEQVADDVGRTIAAIHDLDAAVVDNADLPRYSAERFRQRRLNELDQAATTGQIPSTLLRRWEHAMEERELWSFTPVVTHGDLHEDTMLIEGERVVAVTGWTDLHIGDPADDFAWLTAAPDLDFSEAVVEAYDRHRRGDADPHLMRRAALAAEFALAKWLVRGRDAGNQEMVDEALDLLRQLEDDVELHGGQPIALTPMDASPEPAPAVGPAAPAVAAPVSHEGASGQATSAPTADTPDEPTVAEHPATEDWEDDEPAVITDASVDEEAVGDASEDDRGWTAREEPTPARDEVAEDSVIEDPVPHDDATSPPEPESDDQPTDRIDTTETASPGPEQTEPVQDESEPSAPEQRDAPDGTSDDLSDETTEIETIRDEAPDESSEDAPSETSGSIYERHPGLRPPGA